VAQRWPQLLRRYRDQVAPRLGPWAAIQGPGASAASNSRSDARLREGEDRGRGKGRDKEKENEDDDYKKKGLPRPPTITDIVLEVAHRLGYNNDISSSKWSRQPIFLQSFGEHAAGRDEWSGVQHKCSCMGCDFITLAAAAACRILAAARGPGHAVSLAMHNPFLNHSYPERVRSYCSPALCICLAFCWYSQPQVASP
jgi:hypothetical protein